MLNITIIDDNLLEAVENFNLTIELVSGDATVGNLDNTVISIFDNDREYMWVIIIIMMCEFLHSYHCKLHTGVVHCPRKQQNCPATISI